MNAIANIWHAKYPNIYTSLQQANFDIALQWHTWQSFPTAASVPPDLG